MKIIVLMLSLIKCMKRKKGIIPKMFTLLKHRLNRIKPTQKMLKVQHRLIIMPQKKL